VQRNTETWCSISISSTFDHHTCLFKISKYVIELEGKQQKHVGLNVNTHIILSRQNNLLQFVFKRKKLIYKIVCK